MIVDDPLVDVGKDGTINCKVCARRCRIPKGGTGFCGIRKNVNGKLDLIVYGRPSAFGIDPVEKKPQLFFGQQTDRNLARQSFKPKMH